MPTMVAMLKVGRSAAHISELCPGARKLMAKHPGVEWSVVELNSALSAGLCHVCAQHGVALQTEQRERLKRA
jgi:hypothetical protein